MKEKTAKKKNGRRVFWKYILSAVICFVYLLSLIHI